MVSFQSSISLRERKPFADSECTSKKRKWDDREREEDPTKESKTMLDIELHLETPLPLEWQRCLDLQSGKIHFYNTRTQRRTCKDPRESPEPQDLHPMSLELKLNLPCESIEAHANGKENQMKHHPNSPHDSGDSSKNSSPPRTTNSSGLSRSLSWVSFDADHQEMVAAVCMRCHMLVMLCKSSPSCPNCKFMHPPNENPLTLFKPNLSLLCCKD
ncbi:protein CURLY FLAG LEAF 1-like [Magnolia sinica]|uniref:protein CURLY FLAG LEAF 1-like n=1 Tax=Magnolia sinica TaxID=86752 RepID=UPI00265A6F26|nr:protein CURLY FLAG LEAF 1-like [Magnolia sinica]